MDRDFLNLTTPLFRGTLVPSDAAAPDERVDIRDLPEVSRADFPDVPDDMELRLCQGDAPCLVLVHPATTCHLAVPLTDMEALAPYVLKLRMAVEAFAMGVVPDAS